MSGAVDTKTVEMRFDNSNFEKNAKESMSTLEKLKAALKLDGASSGLKEVEKASKKLEFKDFKNNIDDVGKKFNALEIIATGALLKIGSAAADTGMRVLKSMTIDQVASGWNKYEEKVSSVQTIMANLRDEEVRYASDSKKMEYVNGYLEKLMWFSDETSYSFSEMTSNLGKFIAVGQNLDTSVTAIQGIATWAAMAGQRSEGAARAMYNISQALGVGAMTTIDWKSIENANMATAEFKETAIAAAVAMGKLKQGEVTIESFRESLQKKWFDKDVMMEVFTTYGEAADRVHQYAVENNMAASEAIREIKKQDAKFADSLGFRAFAAAQEAKTFGEVVEATADAVSTKWLRIFENIFGNYLQAKELWTDFSEQLWEIFAKPLDVLNDIMGQWNRGFLVDGPQGIIAKWFESSDLAKMSRDLVWISEGIDGVANAYEGLGEIPAYRIKQLADGTQQLVTYERTASGVVVSHYTELINGREALLQSFQNVLDTLIHDVEDENGKLESMSIFGSLKRGLQEVLFGTSEVGKLVPIVAKKLWNLTLGFKSLTERLKPSMETSLKLKNVFKGLFTVFKIGFKFVKAIFKPFQDLFSRIFTKKEGTKGLLDLADAMGTWIQKLDEFLTENKIFEKVSDTVRSGLDKIEQGLNNLSIAFTGMNIKDLVSTIKEKLFGFFTNYDFKGTFSKVSTFFSNIFTKVSEAANDISKALTGKSIGELWTSVFDKIKSFDYSGTFDKVVGFFKNAITQIKQVKTGDLPEKLTPLQKFLVAVKKVFSALKSFFTNIGPSLLSIGKTIKNAFVSIFDAFAGNNTSLDKVLENRPFLKGLVDMFRGVVDFFKSIGPMLGKIGTFIGGFFSKLGKAIGNWAKDKSPEEIIGSLLKGGFFVTIIRFINSLVGLNKGLFSGFSAVKDVLKAYSKEIKASALLDIALAIGIMALALYGLSKIEDMDKAAEGIRIIGFALGGLMVLKELLPYLSKLSSVKEVAGKKGPLENLKDLFSNVIGQSIFANDSTAKFVKIALGILFAAAAAVLIVNAVRRMGEAIKEIAKIPPETIKEGGKRVAQIVTIFGVFAFLSSWGTSATSALFAAIGAYVLVKAIGKLLDLLADLGGNQGKMDKIKKVGEEFKGVFEVIKTVVKWVIAIAAGMALVQIILGALVKGKIAPNSVAKALKQFGKNFERIAFSLVILVGAIALMAYVSTQLPMDSIGTIALIFGGFIALVGLLSALVAWLAGKAPANFNISGVLKQFGNVFTKVAFSLLILSAALWLFSQIKFGEDGGSSIETIALIFGVFLGLCTILAIGAGVLAAFRPDASLMLTKNIIAISSLFIAVAGSLLLLTLSFYLFSRIKFDSEAGASVEMISGIFGVFAGLVAALVLLAVIVSNTKGGLSRSFVTSIAAIAVLFIAVAGSLYIVAEAFKMFSEIQFGDGASVMQIAGIFGTFIFLVGLIGILAGALMVSPTAFASVLSIAGLMVATAFSLILVAQAFAMLAATVPPENMTECINFMMGLAEAVAILALVGGVLSMASGTMSNWGILAIAGLLIAFGAACLLAGMGVSMAANAIAASSQVLESSGPAANAVIEQLANTLSEFLNNSSILKLLVFGQLLTSFGTACLLAGIGISLIIQPIANLLTAIVNFIDVVAEKGPAFVENFSSVLNGFLDTIISSAPKLRAAVKVVIEAIILGIAENLGYIAACAFLIPLAIAVGFFKGLAAGLEAMLPELVKAINSITDSVDNHGQELRDAGNRLILHLVQGMFLALSDIPKVMSTVWDYFNDWIKNGSDAKSIDYYAAKNGLNYAKDLGNELKYDQAQMALLQHYASLTTEEIQQQAKAYAGKQHDRDIRNGSEKDESYYKNLEVKESIRLQEAKQDAIEELEKIGKDNKPSTVEPKVEVKPKVEEVKEPESDSGIMGMFSRISEKYNLPISPELDPSKITDASSLMEFLPEGFARSIPANIDLQNTSAEDFLKQIESGEISIPANLDLTAGSKAAGGKGTYGAAQRLPGLKDAFALEINDSLTEAAEGVDVPGVLQDSFSQVAEGVNTDVPGVQAASEAVATELQGPIKSLDPYTWGSDIASSLAAGLLANAAAVSAAASTVAGIIHGFLGFSEPDRGPLSDFHTYAPDMIKLWNHGIYKNLGSVETSSADVANTMYDGFSTALDYVSGLIDNGMSDQLTIRPVMDLSEIQNGVDSMNGMLGSDHSYTVTGTSRLAASAAYGMKPTNSFANEPQVVSSNNTPTTNNFYITSNDPNEVANKVSKILSNQTRRQKAVWAHK